MDHHQQEQIALHRWAVIAEAAGDKLTAWERGALARQIAARAHAHPDGSSRTYSRGTIDRWLRAWRKGGLQALMPAQRADTGVVRAHPELFAEAAALRLVPPGRDVSDRLPGRRRAACGAGSQGSQARSWCSRSARSAAMARAVWLLTAPRLMPIAAATSASRKSA